MIIVLNGYPGVGKQTVGERLAEYLGGRLLDIHSIYNIAFALTEFKTPEFRSAVQRLEAIAHDLVLARPEGEPVVLTTVLAGESKWGDAEWSRLEALGKARPPFAVVHLHCDLQENERRIQSPSRIGARKPRDPAMAHRNQTAAKPLYGVGAANLMRLDTTAMTPDAAAAAVADWVRTLDTR